MKRSLESLMSWGPNKEKFLSFLASAWTFFPDKKKRFYRRRVFVNRLSMKISKQPVENVKWVHKMDKYFVLLAFAVYLKLCFSKMFLHGLKRVCRCNFRCFCCKHVVMMCWLNCWIVALSLFFFKETFADDGNIVTRVFRRPSSIFTMIIVSREARLVFEYHVISYSIYFSINKETRFTLLNGVMI